MHEKNIYLGPNLLVSFKKIADNGPMVALMNILGDLVNTNLLSDISISEVLRSLGYILPDKNNFFPKGYLILTFFSSENIFLCSS